MQKSFAKNAHCNRGCALKKEGITGQRALQNLRHYDTSQAAYRKPILVNYPFSVNGSEIIYINSASSPGYHFAGFFEKGISGSALVPNLEADEVWEGWRLEAKDASRKALKAFY